MGRELAEKETQLRLMEQELAQMKKSSILQFVLGVLSAMISGYGINLITTSPTMEVGWILISIAIILQCVSFFVMYQARKRGNI